MGLDIESFTPEAIQTLKTVGWQPTNRSRTPNYKGEPLTISISPALKTAIVHAADHEQSSISNIVRRALLAFLPTIDPQFTTIYNNLRNAQVANNNHIKQE